MSKNLNEVTHTSLKTETLPVIHEVAPIIYEYVPGGQF
jgi:hypothetical protein